MIRLMVTYPASDGSTFDGEYWTTKHMPLVSESWSQVVKWEADLGLPGQPNHAVAHIFFDSAEDMQAALGGPGAATVMGDIVNYTNVEPAIQISTVAAHT